MKIHPLSLIAFVIFLSSCATTQYDTALVFPKENGSYEIVGRGYSESEALANAVYQAEKTCKELQKHYVMLDRSVTYHGVLTREANRVEHALGEAIGGLTNSYVPGTGSEEDYKATLITKCV